MMKRLLVPALALGAFAALAPRSPSAEPKEDWKAAVDKAAAYLKKSQNEDGGWSKGPNATGATGIVVTGLLRCGASPDDAPAAKGITFIEGLVNEKAGHIAGKGNFASLTNYKTSINVMALTAANKGDKYKAVIGNAAKYLKEYQWDEARGKKDDSDF